MYNALQFSHQLLKKQVQLNPKGLFIDATLGNGHDSHFILSLKDFSGELLAFDIQEKAIENAFERVRPITTLSNQNYSFILDTHANVEDYIGSKEIQSAIFNLGYLPGGDHNITTQVNSTIEAIDILLDRLSLHGQIIIVIYSGHDEGMNERVELLERYSHLPQENYQVLTYQFINQINQPPILLVIEKIKIIES